MDRLLEKIREIAGPIAEKRGVKIIEATFKREGKVMVLRLLADKAGGISIDECAEINTSLGAELDKEDVINDRYIIEVSSPGLDRLLKTRNDYEWALGRTIQVNTSVPVEGQNVFLGKLIGISEENLVIEDNAGVSVEIPVSVAAKSKLRIEV